MFVNQEIRIDTKKASVRLVDDDTCCSSSRGNVGLIDCR